MPLVMPFEPTSLTSFPMERLCYDLKLEVLNEMDWKDTIELIRVNWGFQWMISHHPSLVFDRHVDTIRLDEGKVWLKKFPDSHGIALDVNRDFLLINAINSCDNLTIRATYEYFNDEQIQFFKQFKSVNSLWLFLSDGDDLAAFLDSFQASVKEHAGLSVHSSAFLYDQVIKEQFQEFIEIKLNDCQRIDLDFRSQASFDFYDDALKKMRVRFVQISTATEVFGQIVSSIVDHGISSQDLKASVRVDGGQAMGMNVVDFLTKYPGVRRIDGENREKLIGLGNDLLNDEISPFDAESFCFRKNIDSANDCVYICPSNSQYAHFFAFYVPCEM